MTWRDPVPTDAPPVVLETPDERYARLAAKVSTPHIEIDQRNLAARLRLHQEYASGLLKRKINGTKTPWPDKPKKIKVDVAFLQDLRNTLYAAEQIQERGFCEPPFPMQDELERRI